MRLGGDAAAVARIAHGVGPLLAARAVDGKHRGLDRLATVLGPEAGRVADGNALHLPLVDIAAHLEFAQPARWPVQNENKWTLEGLGQVTDFEVEKTSDLEPFVVSADFQNWSNYYQDNIGNCDSFNVQDSPYKSVCFSRLAGNNHTKAMIGLLSGGSGQAGQRYDTELVEQAINSIAPADVARKLEEFEAYRRSNAENQKLRMLMR